MNPVCPKCKIESRLVDSKIIYGMNYGMIYLCANYPDCDYRVGTHKGTTVPLGTMANNDLRLLRRLVHTKVDFLWQKRGYKRGDVYKKLKGFLEIDKDFHIGECNKERCLVILDNYKKWFKLNVSDIRKIERLT